MASHRNSKSFWIFLALATGAWLCLPDAAMANPFGGEGLGKGLLVVAAVILAVAIGGGILLALAIELPIVTFLGYRFGAKVERLVAVAAGINVVTVGCLWGVMLLFESLDLFEQIPFLVVLSSLEVAVTLIEGIAYALAGRIKLWQGVTTSLTANAASWAVGYGIYAALLR